MGMNILINCPICGKQNLRENYERNHIFPLCRIRYLEGRGKIWYEELDDEYIKEELKELVINKCIKFLESQGYEVYLK